MGTGNGKTAEKTKGRSLDVLSAAKMSIAVLRQPSYVSPMRL
jgi:hypothetical protein